MKIEAHGLNFAYRRGGEPILDGWNGDFAEGTMTALTGPSGSGKSTLLYILALLLRPAAGRLRWDGEDVAAIGDRERSALRASRAGFVFQDALLDPSQTVRSNVLEGALFNADHGEVSRERADALLARFGVEHRAHHRPGQISGGQAQRVALCRALISRPQVIFADEPTGNLDRQTADVVLGAFRAEARGGATIVVATHDPFVVERCDRVITMGSDR